MRQRLLGRAVAGLTLSLGIATAATPVLALACGAGSSGKVTSVSSTSITVQTANGAVTSQLTSSTAVLKTTAGSRSDLVAGAYADVTLSAAGSTTVTAVHVATKSAVSHGAVRMLQFTQSSHARHATGTRSAGTRASTRAAAGTHAGGQIVSFANGTLTLKTRQGQSVSYTLASNATITKTVTGKLSDLAVGQTVRVQKARGSTTATTVLIESS